MQLVDYAFSCFLSMNTRSTSSRNSLANLSSPLVAISEYSYLRLKPISQTGSTLFFFPVSRFSKYLKSSLSVPIFLSWATFLYSSIPSVGVN